MISDVNVYVSRETCEHLNIRYCRNPDESVSEQVAIARGARDPLSVDELTSRWHPP